MFRTRHDRERIAHVEFADEVQVEFETGNFKLSRRWAETKVESMNGVVIAEAKALHRTMCDIQQRREVRIVAVAEQQAVARNQADEMRKSFFDRVEIFKNVGVIEFEIVDDGDFGLVMDELAALVEERRVVFVALDDKPFAVREPRALTEIVRDATDQIGRASC